MSDLKFYSWGGYGVNAHVYRSRLAGGEEVAYGISANDSYAFSLNVTTASGSVITLTVTPGEYSSGVVTMPSSSELDSVWNVQQAGLNLRLHRHAVLVSDPRVTVQNVISETFSIENLGPAFTLNSFSEYLHMDDLAGARDYDHDGLNETLLAINNYTTSGYPVFGKVYLRRQNIAVTIRSGNSFATVTHFPAGQTFFDNGLKREILRAAYISSTARVASTAEQQVAADARILLGSIFYKVAGQVRDSTNNPLPGVFISASPGSSITTGASGYYTITNLIPGTYTLTPTLSGYAFSPPTRTVSVPPDATGQDFTGVADSIVNAINQFAVSSNARLNQVLAEAQHSAQDGDYFAVQRQEKQIQLIADAMLDTAGILAVPFSSINKVKDLTKMQAPGVIGSGWGHVIRLRDQYQPARDAFRRALFVAPLTSETAWLASQEYLKGTLIYYAADTLDSLAEELVTDAAIKYGLQVGLQSDLGLQNKNYPGLVKLSQIFQQDITNTAASTITRLPSLTLAEQQAYQTDLTKRTLANIVLASTLERRALPLHLAQDTRESEPGGVVRWLTEFLGKNFLRGALYLCCDGPGMLAVEGGIAFYDLYKNAQRLNEDYKMMLLGAETMGGALSTQKRIYLNTITGLDNIVSRTPPQIASANVTSITNKSIGEYKIFGRLWWWERSSFSEVNLTNAMAFDTVFQVIADYGNTGLLGTSYQPLVAEGAMPINGNQSGVVYVRYKRDGQGASPDENSPIQLYVLGNTDTGLYRVLVTGTTWQPTRVTASGQLAQLPLSLIGTQAEEVPTLPYPIRSAVEVRGDSLTYVPHLWVDNPFTTTVTITLTQPLTDGIQVINANSGMLVGQNLVWSRTISPEATIEITHVVVYTGSAGIGVNYPTALLQMSDSVNSATFTGGPLSFQTQTPLAGEGQPSYQMLINQSTTVPITITNRSSLATTGTLSLTLVSLDGTMVYEASQNVNVAALGSISSALPLSAPAQEGVYILRAFVDSNGGTYEIFANYLFVIQPQLYLPLVRK